MPDEFLVYRLLCLFLALVHVAGPLTKTEGKSSHRYNCSSLLILVWKFFLNLLKDIVGDLFLHSSVQYFICCSVNDLYNLLVVVLCFFFVLVSPKLHNPKTCFQSLQASAYEKQGCVTIAHLVMKSKGYRHAKSCTPLTK